MHLIFIIVGVVVGVYVGGSIGLSVMYEIPVQTAAKAIPYVSRLREIALRYGLPENMLVRVAWQESRFDPNAVNQKSGARGMFQFMPATADEMGIDPFQWEDAADGAARYLSRLYKMFSDKPNPWAHALAAYNWGMGNVMRKGLDKAPDETKEYYSSITRDLEIA